MFQRLQIRYKLLAVLLVPLLALTAFALVQIRGEAASGARAARVARLAAFAGRVTALAHDLQRERDASLPYVARGGGPGDEDLPAQRAKTDNGPLARFRVGPESVDLDGYDPLLRARLGHARERLGQLEDERKRVDRADPAGLARAQRYYGDVIAALLDFDSGIAWESDDPQLARNAAALALLSRLKELASQERGLVRAVLSAGHFAEGQREQLASIAATQDSLAAQFQASAGREQRDAYAAQVFSPNLAKVTSLRSRLLSVAGPDRIEVAGLSDPEGVSKANFVLTEEVNRLRKVELRLDGELVAAGLARQSAARRSMLLDGLLTALALALAVVVALLGSRAMARPLLRLRDAADQMAQRQLPEVVERLQRGELRHLDAPAAPVAPFSGDETGQVARAFDAVRQVVVRVVAEQAGLRMSIGEMFLSLARRSQDLIDRQLRLIDELERDAGPEALEQLFKLDHLATRMRRNAESLIVLAGAEPPRRWSQPVPVSEVLRAALSEVQDYQRVELHPLGELGISGHAVADVVHLLAELIENATSFSPPGTQVQIAGHDTAEGYVLEIEDRGLGMSDEELAEANQRLASPPAVDLAVSRMLGLHVVGRLARRHGIKAQLRHSWYGGVTALVLLPRELMTLIPRRELEPPPLAERLVAPGSLPVLEQSRSEWFDSSAGGGGGGGGGGQRLPRRGATPPSSNGHKPARPRKPVPPAAAPPPAPEAPKVPPPPTSLPRRVPQANLAPGLAEPRQEPPAGQPDGPPSPLSRSPDEIRAMLSSYRSGLERGRRMAADSQQADDRSDRDGAEGSGPTAPRSDDDAAQ
jgi:Nitrate and nitrite sensing/HAMP domain